MSLDLIEDVAYLMDWFEEHEICFVIPYIEQNFHEASWSYQRAYMLKHLFFTKKVIENDMMSNEEKQLTLLNMLAYGKSKIITICGNRGSGKTATASWIMEELHTRNLHQKIYWVIKGAKRPDGFPPYIRVVDDIDDVPNGSFAVIDETAIKYKAREHYKAENKDFISRLVILRHKEISVVLLTQHMKLIDIGIRRLSDILIFKQGANTKKEEEKIDSDIALARQRLKPRDKPQCLIEAGNRLFNFNHPLASWWNDHISKSFSDFNPELETKMNKQERIKYAKDQDDRKYKEKRDLEIAKLREMKKLGITPVIQGSKPTQQTKEGEFIQYV